MTPNLTYNYLSNTNLNIDELPSFLIVFENKMIFRRTVKVKPKEIKEFWGGDKSPITLLFHVCLCDRGRIQGGGAKYLLSTPEFCGPG